MSQSQLDAMAENNNRSSSAAGAAGLASENQNLVDDATALTMYQDLFHHDKEEDLGGAKSLLSLSKKSSLKKTTKTPKPHAPTPRGKGKI